MSEEFNFSEALVHLKNGRSLSRSGWNGKNQFIKAQFPDENSKMNLPYIYISNVDSKLVPWIASQGDIFAEDWFVIE